MSQCLGVALVGVVEFAEIEVAHGVIRRKLENLLEVDARIRAAAERDLRNGQVLDRR